MRSLRLVRAALRPPGPYPVPVLVSLVSAASTPERVELVWSLAGGAGLGATVERRTASSEWQGIGSTTADGTAQLSYVDRTVAPGTRYAYRLAYEMNGSSAHSAETWVEVPAAELALLGLTPNPAQGPLSASFSLPSSAPAVLELLDVTGRRVLSQDVGSLGAGRHVLRMSEGGSVAPGLYWLRLQQGGRAVTSRAVVAR